MNESVSMIVIPPPLSERLIVRFELLIQVVRSLDSLLEKLDLTG